MIANALKNTRVLLLGGGGLVGSSIAKYLCRLPKEFRPAQLIVGALTRSQAQEAAESIRPPQEEDSDNNIPYPVDIVPVWGDMFVRKELAFSKFDHADTKARAMMLEDLYGDFQKAYQQNHLVETLHQFKPHIVVDCINTATLIAYRNAFNANNKLQESLNGLIVANSNKQLCYKSAELVDAVVEDAELAMLSQTGPQLIRHVQMLCKAAQEVGIQHYIKIGTTGTGGMGMNIPYTHSEDRPSRVLLAKTEAAFGHSGLLMLWSQTPGAPSVKELKPAAAIGYRAVNVRRVQDQYGNGSIRKCRVLDLNHTSQLNLHEPATSEDYPELGPLELSVVDMGENGVFARDEFLTITAPNQMEMISPEEIAEQVIEELLGTATGHNVLAAMRGSLLGPGYRAGMERQKAAILLEEADRLSNANAPSIALGKLGPPQISKLLFEANILVDRFRTYRNLINADATDAAREISGLAMSKVNATTDDPSFRSGAHSLSSILHMAPSVGVPIIVEGNKLIRGAKISVPPVKGHSVTIPCPKGEQLQEIADRGWVDLRAPNIKAWQDRAKSFLHTSSKEELDQTIVPSAITAWILSSELGGHRDFFDRGL
jgi:hypothetical protein